MAGGTVHRTIRLLEDALNKLGAIVPMTELERVGVLVNKAMTTQARHFHTPEHVFDLTDKDDAHMTLAALFHDVVYYQVDHGLIPEIADVVGPFITIDDRGVSIVEKPDVESRAFWGCTAVFGFQPGQTLSPFGGLNEFLSALLMALLYAGILSDRVLLIASACIEATIPFRGRNAEGLSAADALYRRVTEVNERFTLGLSEKALVHVVATAVRFANRDVSNFAEENVGRFLDNTWKLLPETNPTLATTGVYTIKSYRTALMKMAGFMGFLDPGTIFGRFDGAPDDETYGRLLERARRNVNLGRRYLGMKLLTAGLLEALACASGGDAPVSYLMGDIAGGDQLADFLPEVEDRPEGGLDPTLHDLLALGRASDSSFDLRNSPLALFVYRALGDAAVDHHLEGAKAMFSGEIEPDQFLQSLPPHLVGAVASAMSRTAFTREANLRPYTALSSTE